MSTAPKHLELISAIILASVLISGSLVFLAIQSGGRPQQNEVVIPQIDEKLLKEQIKTDVMAELRSGEWMAQEVDAGIQRYLQQQPGEWIDQQVDAGIQRYVQKQRDTQEQARADQERQAAEKAKNVPRPALDSDHILGNPNAEISLIEYTDFECPFCKTFHETAHKLVEAYDGKVNWIFRHYPLGFHNPAAQKEAEASECVAELGGQDAFWKFADALYANSGLNGKGIEPEKFLTLVDEAGVKRDEFQACLDSGKHTNRVQQNFNDGSNSGITGTPGNILLSNRTGEIRLKAGAFPFDTMKAEIDQMLSK
jgi:protein-disulfide isomerase